MATTKDITEIKQEVNSLIQEKHKKLIMHHLYLEYHKIYQPGKQTEVKWGNGFPPEG